MAQKPHSPRSVKPRKTGFKELSIIAVSRETDEVYLERTGELFEFSHLPTLVATEPSSIIVSSNVGILVKILDDIFDKDERWQFRLAPIIHEHFRPNRKQTRTVTKGTLVSFFGFRETTASGKVKSTRYHYPVEPQAFIGKTIHELIPGSQSRVLKFYEWGADLREFLRENDLTIRPTSGGIAGQLLKDRKFYSEPRRKVPRATNAKARDQLPGNYYRLYVKENVQFSATYLDQKSAHHSCAIDIEFPDANSLYAKGHFQSPADKPMATRGTVRFKKLIQEHGLFLVNLAVPKMDGIEFPLPCMEKSGVVQAFIFSNELGYIRELGGQVLSIIAQWTSPEIEQGLNRYANWSLARLAESDPQRTEWLKPVLHSSYGILAAKPRTIEFGFKRAKGGEDKTYPVGSALIHVKAKTTTNTHEMPTANVIHRGMIEAETRLRSIRLAKLLQSKGMKILAIYADSIFVDTSGKRMPLLDNRWHVKGELERLQFFSSTSFTSDILTKLPGIPKESQERFRVLEAMREERAMNDPAYALARARLSRAEPDSVRRG